VFVVNAFHPLSRPFDLSSVPRVRGREVTLLWADDWWDGPRAGICSWKGSKLWFEFYFDRFLDVPGEEDDARAEIPVEYTAVLSQLLDSDSRILLLHAINPAQLAEEERWHRLFLENVGPRWGDPTGLAEHQRQPQSRWPVFYDRYHAEKPTWDLASIPVVAVWIL